MSSGPTRRLRHAIRRELDSLELAPAVVPGGEVSADSGQSLRSPGDQLREKVPPVKRQRFLRNAIQRSGPLNYLIRHGHGHTYKARIHGQDYVGTFAQVWDQAAPFLLPFVDKCL